jgi:hypothetical protein
MASIRISELEANLLLFALDKTFGADESGALRCVLSGYSLREMQSIRSRLFNAHRHPDGNSIEGTSPDTVVSDEISGTARIVGYPATRLTLGPKDVLVVRVDHEIDHDVALRIKDSVMGVLEKSGLTNGVMVLDRCASLQVLKGCPPIPDAAGTRDTETI